MKLQRNEFVNSGNMLRKNRKKGFYLFPFVLLLLISCTGCKVLPEKSWIPDWTNVEKRELPPFSRSRSKELDSQTIRNVLVVPFLVDKGPEREAEMVTRVFKAELANANLFKLVTPSERPLELIDVTDTLWELGFVDVDSLVEAKKKYMVDAFLFGQITSFKPYIPLVLGVKITLVSALTGGVLWSVDGVFNSEQKEVVKLAKDYYKGYYSSGQSLYGWELMLVSMERYSQFISNMLISTIAKPRQ